MSSRAATLTLALGALCAVSAMGQLGGDVWPDQEAPLLEGVEVLRRVRESFPSVPLRVRAQLLVRDQRGEIERTLNAALRLAWHGRPPEAQFVVLDAFGGLLAQAILRRTPGGTAHWTIYEGDPPVEQQPPRPHEAIAGTPFTWRDLSLEPLWWSDARTLGTEMRKSRLCYVIEVRPPPNAGGGVARVRLLVDSAVFALLEAETFDVEGRRLKRLEVKSLKKVGDTWTLQDLEVRDFTTRRRTTLRVLESVLETESEAAQ